MNKFTSVEECLDFIPEEELAVAEILRALALECIPNVKEKLGYNVPFYHRYGAICFIWPASVLWGKQKTYEGVRFGFTKGYLLTDPSGYLDKAHRKHVYWKDFSHPKFLDIPLLKSLLFEAVLIDEQVWKEKRTGSS